MPVNPGHVAFRAIRVSPPATRAGPACLKKRVLSMGRRSKSGSVGLLGRVADRVLGRDDVPTDGWAIGAGRGVKAGRRPPVGEALTARSVVVGQWDSKSA